LLEISVYSHILEIYCLSWAHCSYGCFQCSRLVRATFPLCSIYFVLIFVTYFMLWLFADNKVYEVIFLITDYMLFSQILYSLLRNFTLISLKTSVEPVVNNHDLEITSHKIFIPLIYINLCHQMHWCCSRRDLIMLDVSYNIMVVLLLMYKFDHINCNLKKPSF